MSTFAQWWRKLNMVVTLDSFSGATEGAATVPAALTMFDEFPLQLVIQLDGNSFGPKDFYRRVREHAAALGVAAEVQLEEHANTRVTLDYLIDTYELSGDMYERVRMANIRAAVSGGVPRARSTAILIDGGATLNATADDWVRLVADVPGFRQAYLIDCAFDYWQNNKHLSSYTTFGRSSAGLVTKPNGLPPPLAEVEVDISAHLGRKTYRVTHEEVVASQLWFSDAFWSKVNLARADFSLDTSVGIVTDFAPSVLKIVAAETPFSDRSSNAKLDALRRAIYGAANEVKS